MALNASIFGNMLNAPKSPEEYTAEREQLQSARMTNMLNRQKMDEYQAGVKRQGELRNLLMGGANADALRRGGFLSEAADMEKNAAEVGFKKAQTLSSEAQARKADTEANMKVWESYRDQASMIRTPQEAAAYLSRGYNDPVIGPYLQRVGSLEEGIARIPQDPAGFEQWRMGVGMNVEKLAKHALDQQQQAETMRHNRSQEANAAGQLRVAQGNLGLRQQELEQQRLMPKGQVVQSDQGVMLVDPRTGLAQPVKGQDGAPITRQMKDIPASVNTAILSNAQSLSKIQQALDLLDGKNVGELKGDKSATGWKGFLPNTALNRIDPQGVDARAMIADIGSLIIHDRSGAAVTAAESPRLMPFIPLVTDDAATAKKKLTRFKQLYEQEQQAMQDVYSKEQGYRAPASRQQMPQSGGASGSWGNAPQVGSVEQGHRFKGGNPADPNNWEKVK